jgi:hypothetical protein
MSSRVVAACSLCKFAECAHKGEAQQRRFWHAVLVEDVADPLADTVDVPSSGDLTTCGASPLADPGRRH